MPFVLSESDLFPVNPSHSLSIPFVFYLDTFCSPWIRFISCQSFPFSLNSFCFVSQYLLFSLSMPLFCLPIASLLFSLSKPFIFSQSSCFLSIPLILSFWTFYFFSIPSIFFSRSLYFSIGTFLSRYTLSFFLDTICFVYRFFIFSCNTFCFLSRWLSVPFVFSLGGFCFSSGTLLFSIAIVFVSSSNIYFAPSLDTFLFSFSVPFVFSPYLFLFWCIFVFLRTNDSSCCFVLFFLLLSLSWCPFFLSMPFLFFSVDAFCSHSRPFVSLNVTFLTLAHVTQPSVGSITLPANFLLFFFAPSLSLDTFCFSFVVSANFFFLCVWILFFLFANQLFFLLYCNDEYEEN